MYSWGVFVSACSNIFRLFDLTTFCLGLISSAPSTEVDVSDPDARLILNAVAEKLEHAPIDPEEKVIGNGPGFVAM